LLPIGEAQIGILPALEGLLSFQHGKLAKNRLRQDNLPALVIQGHAAFNHQGGLVAGGDPQATHHAGTMEQTVEQLPFGAVVPLLHLKVPHGEQLSVKISVALKGERKGIIHGWLLQLWYRSGWWPVRR